MLAFPTILSPLDVLSMVARVTPQLLTELGLASGAGPLNAPTGLLCRDCPLRLSRPVANAGVDTLELWGDGV